MEITPYKYLLYILSTLPVEITPCFPTRLLPKHSEFSLINMEQVNLGYSMKNIHVPSENTYLYMMVNSVEKLIHNLRWRAFFYLKPQSKSISNQENKTQNQADLLTF